MHTSLRKGPGVSVQAKGEHEGHHPCRDNGRFIQKTCEDLASEESLRMFQTFSFGDLEKAIEQFVYIREELNELSV